MKSKEFVQICIQYFKDHKDEVFELIKAHKDGQYTINLFNDPQAWGTYERCYTRSQAWKRGVKRKRPDGTMLRIFEAFRFHIAFITDCNDEKILFQSKPTDGCIKFIGSGHNEDCIKPFMELKI